MRHNLNGAATEIATALKTKIGIRRTYGGTDDARRMHISWQLLKHGSAVGMIDLFCEDGLGHDGMDWHGSVRITAPGIDYEQQLIGPWHGLKGRRAKRITRQRFVENINKIIVRATSNDSRFLQDRRRACPTSFYRLSSDL